jgi:hypothetical protein
MAAEALVAVAAGRWGAEDLAAAVVTLAAVAATSGAAAATLAAGTSAAGILEEPATSVAIADSTVALATSVAIADSTVALVTLVAIADSTAALATLVAIAHSTGAVGLTVVARSMVAQPGISAPVALPVVLENSPGQTFSGSPIRAWAAMPSAAARCGLTRPVP